MHGNSRSPSDRQPGSCTYSCTPPGSNRDYARADSAHRSEHYTRCPARLQSKATEQMNSKERICTACLSASQEDVAHDRPEGTITKLEAWAARRFTRACCANGRSTGSCDTFLSLRRQCAAAVCLFLNGTWIALEMARGREGIRPDIHLRQATTQPVPHSITSGGR